MKGIDIMKNAPMTFRGVGFFGLLTIVLIALKLTNLIQISWWVIVAVFFAPILILIAISIAVAIFFGFVYIGAFILDFITRRIK